MDIKGLTLSELNKRIKGTIQSAYPRQLWVIGEISELRVNSSGHCYMELVEKDPDSENIIAKQKAVAWASAFRMIDPYFEATTGYRLCPGMKILISVQVEFHELYGISLIIKDIEPGYTLGDLAKKKREVIKRLQDEGVIDMNRNLPFPMVPQNIAVISSDTAAGYGDFMNSLHGNPYGFRFRTRLFSAVMQGEQAGESIIEAMEKIYLKESSFDVVVIIRGGGVTSDLECFNNYDLVYHMAQFPLPVITGIGHERDETVADMVAHTALKTPTAVAEFLIDSLSEFYELLTSAEEKCIHLVKDLADEKKQKISQLSHDLSYRVLKIIHAYSGVIGSFDHQLVLLSRQFRIRMKERLEHYNHLAVFYTRQKTRTGHQKILELEAAVRKNISSFLLSGRELIDALEKNVGLLDPLNVLRRGFSITSVRGKIIKDSVNLKEGDILLSQYYKGSSRSRVVGKEEESGKTEVGSGKTAVLSAQSKEKQLSTETGTLES